MIKNPIKRKNILDKELMAVVLSFHRFEQRRLYIYLKNFGGFYASRTKDGFSIGYLDQLKKIGKEDHATILYDSKKGWSGLHRTLVDSKNTVYFHYDLKYIKKDDGLRVLLIDLLNDEQMPGYMKAFILLAFHQIRVFYKMGTKKIFVLSRRQTKNLKMNKKYPCVFIETGVVGKIQLAAFSKLLPVLRYYSDKRFGDKPSSGFNEQNLKGVIISKKESKLKSSSNTDGGASRI